MHEAGRGEAVRRSAREGDPDRALSALFAPRDARSDLFALYAFNVELARIAEQVSEPHLGAIKLQWWRDAVDQAAYGVTTGQPVARLARSRVESCTALTTVGTPAESANASWRAASRSFDSFGCGAVQLAD